MIRQKQQGLKINPILRPLRFFAKADRARVIAGQRKIQQMDAIEREARRLSS